MAAAVAEAMAEAERPPGLKGCLPKIVKSFRPLPSTNGASIKPQKAPMSIWVTAAAATARRKVVSGAAARVEATLLKSIHGINSWKETCRVI